MVSTASPRPRRKPDRKIRLTRPIQDNEPGVAVITVGREANAYTVTRLASEFGTAFRIAKIGLTPTEPEEPPQAKEVAAYSVNLDGALSSCECPGFLRWQRCKHVDGLMVLHQRGLI